MIVPVTVHTLSDAELFQIRFIIVLNSAFASIKAPSILIFRAVRIIAKSVACIHKHKNIKCFFVTKSNVVWYNLNSFSKEGQGLFLTWNSTVPSSCRGMFMATSLLHAILLEHSFPNPKGGLILRKSVTTSVCFIKPLASGSYSDHKLINSPRWWAPKK